MRHLSVPSKQTAHWRRKLSDEGWLNIGYGIHDLNENRGLPLNENAPEKIENFEILELQPKSSGPKHWTERLDQELFESYSEFWPMSHDQIGDVITIKIPQEIDQYKPEIGTAILQQHPNSRIVCADNGVKGEFRVRDLEVISPGENSSTLTKVKENGNEFFTDPGEVYYSPRLATERQKTIKTAEKLAQKLGRKISVCDPYAGVGPALVPLANCEAVSQIYAADLNPKAYELLNKNLPDAWTACRDARRLAEEIPQCCDLLLVNIPHSTMDHLPELIGLLKTGHIVAVKGWAIVQQDQIKSLENKLNEIFENADIKSIRIDAQKSYSPSDVYANFELEIQI